MKTLDEIRQIKKSVEGELLRKPGVNAVEVGYKIVNGKKTNELAIRVHVKKKKVVPKEQMIPQTIEGVKTDVIERTYSIQPLKVPVEEIKIQADTGIYNPITGGISIGPCRIIDGSVYAGTLGAPVIKNATNDSMMLSNFHVMCVNNEWKVGDTMSQPSLVDGGACPDNVVGTLQVATLSNTADCAVAHIDEQARGITCEIVDIGNVAGTSFTAVLNTPVRKRGRTTLLTFGMVESLDQTVTVDYGGDIGTRTLINQIGVEPDTSRNAMFSDHGDSGSVVVNDNSQVIGLLFAGSQDGHSTANPIQAVLEALNVSICSGQPQAKKEEVEAMNIKAEAMNIKAEAMNIKAEAMNIKAEAMNIKAEAARDYPRIKRA